MSAEIEAESIDYWKVITSNYKEDFNTKLVAKNNDIMWFITPIIGRKENGVIATNYINDTNMFMLKENIKQVKITDFSGANDQLMTLKAVDIEGNTHSAVQYAFFSNLEDALKACERTPENGFNNWEDYIKEVSDLIKYKYRIVTDYKCGDFIKTREVLENGEKLVTKVSRLLAYGLELTKLQTVGNLYNEIEHKYFLPEEEVLVLEDKGLVPKLTYKGQKVDIVCFDVIVDSKLKEI